MTSPQRALTNVSVCDSLTANEWLPHDGRVSRVAASVTSVWSLYPQGHSSVTLEAHRHAGVTLDGQQGN